MWTTPHAWPRNLTSKSVFFLWIFISVFGPVRVTNEIIITYLRDLPIGNENVERTMSKHKPHEEEKHNNQAHNKSIWILENYAIDEIRKIFPLVPSPSTSSSAPVFRSLKALKSNTCGFPSDFDFPCVFLFAVCQIEEIKHTRLWDVRKRGKILNFHV